MPSTQQSLQGRRASPHGNPTMNQRTIWGDVENNAESLKTPISHACEEDGACREEAPRTSRSFHSYWALLRNQWTGQHINWSTWPLPRQPHQFLFETAFKKYHLTWSFSSVQEVNSGQTKAASPGDPTGLQCCREAGREVFILKISLSETAGSLPTLTSLSLFSLIWWVQGRLGDGGKAQVYNDLIVLKNPKQH